MMRAIGQVQDAPVIADLDTGFGNAVNVAYVVPQYTAAGVAAVVIEDKTFPRTRAPPVAGQSSFRSVNFKARWQRRKRPEASSSLRGPRR